MFAVFNTAVRAIITNKLRSFLTTLGVIIGVGSVVLLTSIGTGLTAYVNEQFDTLGSNTIFVSPGRVFSEDGGFAGRDQTVIESTRPVLKRSYLDKILRDNREYVETGVATGVSTADAKFGDTTERATLYGVTASYPQVQNSPARIGRWFTQSEENQSERVVLLGSAIADDLFGKVDPIQKKLRLGTATYTVLGVLEETGGTFGGPSFDEYVYVPLQTLQDTNDDILIDSFLFKAKDESVIDEAIAGIETALLDFLEEDEFTVFDQAQLLETIEGVLGALTVGLGAISGISLVVGGIGIMNIMLVSVTERTREIGLRKALGATPNSILAQFLVEGAMLSLLGGVIGVLIAFAGTFIVQQYFPAEVTWQAVLLAFGVSTLVGLIFSAAPARKAAKLSPIEALRYE